MSSFDTPLLGDSDLRRYLVARMISIGGSTVTYVVMPVLVYGITGSAAWTSLVVVAEGLPYLLLGLWAGALADHVDRKRLMVAADLTAAGLLATLPLAWWLGGLTAPHVIIVAFLVQVVFVFFDAANFGALPSLVPRRRLPSANSLVYGGGMVLETLGPAFTGLALALIEPAPLLVLDVVSFIAAALLIRAVLHPFNQTRAGSRPSLSTVVEGLRFIARHSVVRPMTIVGTLQVISGGAFVALLVVWADEAFGIREGDGRLGLLYAAWGLGALLGTIVMPLSVKALGGARTVLVTLPASAVAAFAAVLMSAWWAAGLALVGWGVGYLVVATNAITVRQQVTPEPLMSRVMTTGRMLTFGAGYPLGALVAGILAEHSSAVTALLTCFTSLVVASAYCWLSPLRTAPKHLVLSDEAQAAS